MEEQKKDKTIVDTINNLSLVRQDISKCIRDAVIEARHLSLKDSSVSTLNIEKLLISVDESLRIMEDIFADVFRVLLYEVKTNTPELMKEMEFQKNMFEVFLRILMKKGIVQEDELSNLIERISLEMMKEQRGNKEEQEQGKAEKDSSDLN